MRELSIEKIQKFLSAYYNKDVLPDRREFKRIFALNLQKNLSLLELDDLCNKIKNLKSKQTILQAACTWGYATIAECLLKKGADPNQCNESCSARYPLHAALEKNHIDVVKILLDDTRTDPNCQNEDGETILYKAVKNNNTEQVELILNYPKVDVNLPTVKGSRPIQYAALNSSVDIIKIMLEKSGERLDLLFIWDNKEILYDSLLEKYGFLQLPKMSEKTEMIYFLMKSLIKHDEDSFNSYFDKNFNMNQEEYEKLILLCFQENRVREFRKILTECEKQDIVRIKKEMLFAAVEEGSKEIIQLVLELRDGLVTSFKIDEYDDVFMDWAKKVASSIDRYDEDIRKNKQSKTMCLLLLLDKKKKYCTDDSGNTLLHIAANFKNEAMIDELLNQGFYIHAKNKFGSSPLSNMEPNILSRCLNNRMKLEDESPENYNSEDNTLTINHSFLDPYSNGHEINDGHYQPEMESLDYISKNSNLKYLLIHPVLSSFVDRKWNHINNLLCLNLMVYTFFHLSLNLNILISTYEERNKLSTHEWSQSLIIPIIISSLLLFIRELIQIILTPMDYLKNYVNWIDLSMIALAFFIISRIYIPFDRELKATFILLTTFRFVSLLGRVKNFTMPYLIFGTVAKNVVKELVLYINYLWAFALIFFLIFSKKQTDEKSENPSDSDEGKFDEIWISVFNVVIMATGELNSGDIPFQNKLLFDRIIFILFTFIVLITIFNLLTGFVVSDIDAITKQAQIHSIKYKINVILNIEKVYSGTNSSVKSSKLRRKIQDMLINYGVTAVFLFDCKPNETGTRLKPTHQLKITPYNCRDWHNNNDYLDDKILPCIKEILVKRCAALDGEKYDLVLKKIDKIENSIDKIEKLIEGYICKQLDVN